MIVYIGALLFAAGGWMITLSAWRDALTPSAVGGLLVIVGSVLAPKAIDYLKSLRSNA